VGEVHKADADANFPDGTRVLTQAGCTAIGTALHQMIQKMAQVGPVFANAEFVLAELQNFGLHPEQFIGRHTVVLG
jgi:hypothetical protein